MKQKTWRVVCVIVGLAAGLGVGTLAEVTKRTLGLGKEPRTKGTEK